jgi:hypothetical protein
LKYIGTLVNVSAAQFDEFMIKTWASVKYIVGDIATKQGRPFYFNDDLFRFLRYVNIFIVLDSNYKNKDACSPTLNELENFDELLLDL